MLFQIGIARHARKIMFYQNKVCWKINPTCYTQMFA